MDTQFFRLSFLLMRAGLLLGLMLLSYTTTFSQGTAVKEDGRFSVTIETSGTGTLNEVDETKLLKGFDLAIQWWTLLGEPIEYYDFRWFASDHYKLDGRRIFRSDLEKYPDLLKRFDNLRPSEISILLTGSYGESSKGIRKAPADLAPFYSSGTYKFLRHTEFKYLVKNTKLMISKSGKIGSGIVPGSPRDWEHFIQYRAFIHPNSPTLWNLVKDNKYLNNTADLSEDELDYRRKQLKKVFQTAKQVRLHAEIAHIKWPEYELRAIAERYEQYENGEQEPSPKEIVEQRINEEVAQIAEYKADDFWSEPEIIEQPELVIFEDYNASGYQKYGVRDKKTGRVILENKYEVIKVLDDVIVAAEEFSYELCNVESRNRYRLYNNSGVPLGDNFYSFEKLESSDSGYMKLKRIISATYTGKKEKKEEWLSSVMSVMSTFYEYEFRYETNIVDKNGISISKEQYNEKENLRLDNPCL